MREMKFSTLGIPAKRRIGNPPQNRFDPACYLAYRKQLRVAATRVLRHPGQMILFFTHKPREHTRMLSGNHPHSPIAKTTIRKRPSNALQQ